MKNGYNNLSLDEIEEANDALDPFSFEKYCNSCMFFNTKDCPYIDDFYEGKYYDLTEWKNVKCDKFYD